MTANIHPTPASATAPQDPLSPERRQRIIEGAAQIFVRDGYEGASMSQIATAANVSKGTLYNYFPSKQALFGAFVRTRCDRLVAEVFGESPRAETPAAALQRMGVTMLRMLVSPDGLALYRVVVMEAVKFPELAQSFFDAGPKIVVGRLADWLIQQSQAGALRVADPHFAAEQFFALTQTRLVMRARMDTRHITTPGDIARVVGGAVDVFLAAYGTTT